MKVFCILNPLSSDGTCIDMWPLMEKFLKNESVEYELIQYQGDLRQKVQDILENLKKEDDINNFVIAGIGGDGTHHALINGIMNFRDKNPKAHIPPYAIIPLGTGNNIAKSFGLVQAGNIKASIETAVKIAIHGENHQVDLGKINGRWFLDAFTVGVDAHILAGRNRDRAAFTKNSLAYRLLKGYPLYLYNTVKSLWKCKPLYADISVDGKKWHSGPIFNLVINNTSIYAGELDLTDFAPADDGFLDAVVFTGTLDYLRRYLFAHRYLPKAVRTLSFEAQRSIQHIRGKTFEIELERPTLNQIAGEELPLGKSFKVETFPEILTIKK